MEWFVRHRHPLFHEERLPARNDGISAWQSLHTTRCPPQAIEEDRNQASKWEREWQAWWTRHALRAARGGGLFPDIVFRRLRDAVEVSWGPVHGKDTPEFSEALEGVNRLVPRAVAAPLHDVLSSATEYLVPLAPGQVGPKRCAEISERRRIPPGTERNVSCGLRGGNQREGRPNRVAACRGISVSRGRRAKTSHVGGYGIASACGVIISCGTHVRFSWPQAQET